MPLPFGPLIGQALARYLFEHSKIRSVQRKRDSAKNIQHLKDAYAIAKETQKYLDKQQARGRLTTSMMPENSKYTSGGAVRGLGQRPMVGNLYRSRRPSVGPLRVSAARPKVGPLRFRHGGADEYRNWAPRRRYTRRYKRRSFSRK